MRSVTLATLSFSALVALAPMAIAQSFTPPSTNGLGGAAGMLNNLVNPQQNNRGNSSPSNGYGNGNPNTAQGGGPYARFTDDQLRTEQRRMQNEQHDIDDEMRRRNLR